MPQPRKSDKRRYDAPARRAAAARTREAILRAAVRRFEADGWIATTVAAVAEAAGVSPKTVEATFGTKAALLQASVDFAIRGDAAAAEMLERPSIAEMERVAAAAEMLDLHARHVRVVNERSSALALVVEHAASADARVSELWEQMNRNRTTGVRWAARIYAAKSGASPALDAADVETVFWVALDWATFRTVTSLAGRDADGFEAWLRGYYRALLL